MAATTVSPTEERSNPIAELEQELQDFLEHVFTFNFETTKKIA